jgi:hypothetical protein
MVPDNTQYLTALTAGSLEEVLNVAALVPGSGIAEPWKRADSASRSLLGMGLDELLFSWTGTEFAVFGIEGRPSPVILVEVKDERKRQEVFDKAFRSVFVNENIRLSLDGTRLPRIELPAFLSNLLLSMGIKIPSPYYTVHDGCLFISESPEALLAAVNSVRRNTTLLKSEVWRTMANTGTNKSSFTLFYSLDRSLPFFLKANALITPVLRLYRQGFVQLSLENHELRLELSVMQGLGIGLELVPGFPLEIRRRIENQVYDLKTKKKNESNIFLTQGNTCLAINPADLSLKTLEITGNPGRIWLIPAEGINGAVWAVNSQGRVYLANNDLETLQGFPRITGLRVAAGPAAWGGKLYLSDFSNNEGAIHVIDEKGSLEKWPQTFEAPILSPLSFINFQSKTYTACYPKEFLGGIWLLDSQGAAVKGWPVPVSGIAFGSPVLFAYLDRLNVAFVTQAGELTVHDEAGQLMPGFPQELEGVFYVQPVFDGEYLWLISADGTLFQVSMEGSILSHKILNLEVKEEGCLIAVDVDGSGKPTIFISGEGNALYGFTRNFQSLEGFPLPIWGKPAFADFLGRGKTGISGAGMDNRVYLWQFN